MSKKSSLLLFVLLWTFAGWVAAMLLWPVETGVATLAGLFVGTFYLALRVWPGMEP